MEREAFQQLSRPEVASIMAAAGPKVCVFPFNGTRRWFMLEQAGRGGDVGAAYFEAVTDRLIELSQLLFEHGVATLLMPLLSPHLFRARGPAYTDQTVRALSLLTDDPRFLAFYRTYDVRVRFYGEFEAFLSAEGPAELVDRFNAVTTATAGNRRHRLFWGICADDAVNATASLAVRHYRENGVVPDRRALIEGYYGEYVPPVDIFISSAKPRAFDMPLLSSGREDLYFTVTPSPYLNERQLRDILYDHMFSRRNDTHDYDAMSPDDWAALRQFYVLNQGKTLGVGARLRSWGPWHPLPQVMLPEELI